MIENFRYTSSWDKFEEAVKVMKDLLSQGNAYWLVGLMGDFDLYIDDTAAEKIEKEILHIIYGEIVYLVNWRLEKGKLEKKNIHARIVSESGEISEEEIESMVQSVCNKLELAEDAVDIEKLAMRYTMKRESVSPKLSEFKYNIHTSNSSKGEKINCALISLSCKKKWEDMRSFFTNQEENVTFICDEEDIDFLIHQLEEVKQKIKGS